MVNLYIIAVGKLKENYLRDAMDEYSKRLSVYCKFNVIEIPETKAPSSPSNGDIANIVRNEGKQIISKIPSYSYVYSMCIEGKQFSSEAFAKQIEKIPVMGKSNIVFIIGSSFGLSDEVKDISDCRLSMSAMTFPHQLARIMITEQIYRGFGIINNTKYHK